VKGTVTRTDHALGAALCVLYVAVLLFTAPDLGLARDESIYVSAAESYGRWFSMLVHEPARALTQTSIDAHWGANHEHPALVKTLFALSALADQQLSVFGRYSLSFRFVGMLSAGLLLWLLHIFGTRLYNRRVGLFAALCYALLPRPFYHAHLCAFDVPITLAVTAVAYAYLRSLHERRYAHYTGLLFGLALATKHNSWILPGIFAVHFAWVTAVERLRRRRGAPPSISLVPHALIAMLAYGPLIFVASWPWLWHDTLRRIGSYAAFHLHHDYYNIEYFGRNYFWPPFPISYPWVMTLYTVPVTTLLLATAGLTLVLRAGIGELRALRAPSADLTAPGIDPQQATVLLLGCLLAPLLIISLPSTPIFGGTKHWFTAYPFLALFAGLGFDRALVLYRTWLPGRFASLQNRIAVPVGALLLLPGLVETAHSHPFGLSHYGFAAGFVPGAADRGMNRQFWGFTTGSLVDFFYEHLPNGGRVYVCDTTDTAFRLLARDGLLPENIVPTDSIADADYALVHHEKHFLDVDVQIWSTYGSVQPAYVLTYDGVPIISVYENPRRKAEKHSPRGR